MSKYTTEVRFICENNAGLVESAGGNSVDEVIAKSWDKIFDKKCEFFDENYRQVLCSKILRHYYLREIGSETVGIWKMWVNTRMNEIMPYYNEMYKSKAIEFNPMFDVDLTRKHNRKAEDESKENGTRGVTGSGNNSSSTDGTNSSTGSNSDTRRDLFSDTPQGSLTGVESETYLTNATKIMDSGERNASGEAHETGVAENSYKEDDVTSKTGSASSTEDYLESLTGKQGSGSYSKLLMEYRDTFVNIDMLVIDEFADLFMGLW